MSYLNEIEPLIAVDYIPNGCVRADTPNGCERFDKGFIHTGNVPLPGCYQIEDIVPEPVFIEEVPAVKKQTVLEKEQARLALLYSEQEETSLEVIIND